MWLYVNHAIVLSLWRMIREIIREPCDGSESVADDPSVYTCLLIVNGQFSGDLSITKVVNMMVC